MSSNNQAKAREILARSPWCSQQDAMKAWDEAVALLNAPPETWTGEGLPPVGTHVVVHDDGSLMYGQGESGEVLAHVDGCAVIRMSYGLGCFLPRCLRTTEQIAAEERELARTEVLNAMTADGRTQGENEENWQFRMQIVGEMLDMGYRKQVSE